MNSIRKNGMHHVDFKKILMIVGDFNEDLEVYFPYQAMLMNNYLIDTVSPAKIKEILFRPLYMIWINRIFNLTPKN